MSGRLREHWRYLRQGPPGERFLRYHQWRRERSRHPLGRHALLVLGLLLVPLGVVMMPAPGPGFIVVGLGLCLLASASRRVARSLDRTERWWRQRRR